MPEIERDDKQQTKVATTPDDKPAELKTEVAAKTEEPWSQLIFKHELYLAHLECIIEAFELIIPILEEQDKARSDKTVALLEGLQKMPDWKERAETSETLIQVLKHVRKLTRANRMFREGIITSTVSKFDEFLVSVLKTAYLMNTSWLKSNEKKLSYKDVLDIPSLEQLKSDIIEREIEELMRDSHYNQVSFLDGKLKLGISEGFDRWKDFLEITERRNLFVHTGGRISSVYLENCLKWDVSVDQKCKEGDFLHASNEYIRSAVECFYEISIRIIQATTRRLFPAHFAYFDHELNQIIIELLTNERWALADRICKYALGIPKNLTGGHEITLVFTINRCIALKFGGKEFEKELATVDWRPYHPKYHFAIAVLNDDFNSAVELMKAQTVYEAVKEAGFKSWPLLREFRKTEGFQVAYKEIFEKDFSTELVQRAEEQLLEITPVEKKVERPSSEIKATPNF